MDDSNIQSKKIGPSIRLTSKEDYTSLLDRYNTWMFDCDGVLWTEDHPIDGAADVLALLRSRNKKILFVTNNATKSRKNYKTKFDQLAIEAHVDEIFGSAYASAVYLSSVINLPKDKKVYVIGMAGLEDELREEGISYIGGTDPADCTLEPFSLANFTLDPDVAAVLCGLDRTITYTKLSKAFQYLSRNPDCRFLVTNADRSFPASSGLLPGAGAISAPLQFALPHLTPLSIGKPSQHMLQCIRAKVDFDPERTIIVGDRLDTDILFGKAGGLSTLLVMTGVTTEQDVAGRIIIPDYITESIGDLRKIDDVNPYPHLTALR